MTIAAGEASRNLSGNPTTAYATKLKPILAAMEDVNRRSVNQRSVAFTGPFAYIRHEPGNAVETRLAPSWK